MKYCIGWSDTKGNHVRKYDSEDERDRQERKLLMQNVLMCRTWQEA